MFQLKVERAGQPCEEKPSGVVNVELLQPFRTDWATLWIVEIFDDAGKDGVADLPARIIESTICGTPVPVLFTSNPGMILSPQSKFLDTKK